MRKLISTTVFGLALAACGGGQKSVNNGGGSSGGGHVPPPPPPPTAGDPTAKAPPRDISKDARTDFKAAYDAFLDNDTKNGWTEQSCRSMADKFASIAREHSELIEAQLNAARSYLKCNMFDDAEKALQAAIHMKADAAKIAGATSDLGDIYYHQGKIDGAKQYWDTAIKANGKLVGARVNTASLEIEQMRKINNPKDANWQKLQDDVKFQLSSALGVNSDSVEAYTDYGLLYLEGWQQNKNRLDLAKLLLDEAQKRNAKYAALQNAYGLYYLHKGSLNDALTHFSAAVESDPKFVEARMNVGETVLGFRKYDVAKENFSKVLELQPKNYDAMIGLGVAQRGLNDFDGAEASFKKAKDLDGRRGEAFYNLGVLYKAFRATKVNDPDPVKGLKTSQNIYRQASDFFKQFLDKDGDAQDKAEAKNNMADCEKVIKQMDEAIKNIQSQPAQPPPEPTPAAPPGGAAPAGSPPAAGAPAPAPGK